MPSSLFGERFVGMRAPAWHKLGITLPDEEQITASEAFELGKLNYQYHTLPIGVTLPDGSFIAKSKEMAVYREPTDDDPVWQDLGIVSKGYSYLQNTELAAGIDKISEKTGWAFETAGALGVGETVFVCLRTGKHSVHGDEVDSFFLVSDGKAANRALRIAVTPVRVVCQNTLIASESNSSLSITVPHTAGVESEYAFWLDMIAQLEQSQEEAFEELRHMGEVKISDEVAQSIFLEAFPEPVMNQRVKFSKQIPNLPGVSEKTVIDATTALSSSVQAYEYNMAQSIKWREASSELYERFNSGDERGGSMSKASLEKLRNTPYAALQAVTELCDWGGTNRDTVASAALFGGRAAQKARAWSAAAKATRNV